jgi:DNA-binding NarL/FixJ family response regulator
VEDCGSILVVDGDDESRAAAVYVGTRLGYEVDARGDAGQAVGYLSGRRPALAIVAVELPAPTSGLELMQELHEAYGDDLPVILLSAERTTSLDRITGLLLGADDYLTKPFDRGELHARARRSLRRSGRRMQNGDANGLPNSDVNLSPREREILALLADGKTQQQIASTLVISPKTVATHIQHLLAKLGVNSRAQAVAAAFKLGLGPDVEGHALVAELAVSE